MDVIRNTDEIKSYMDGRKTAVALGAFDGLHIGHRAVIEKVLRQDLMPVVFTFRDNPAETLAGACRYLSTVEERLRVLESWGVKAVIMPDFSDIVGWSAERFLYMLRSELCAQVISCGEDFSFGKKAAGNTALLSAFCNENGMELQITPAVLYRGERVSSTRIRDAIEKGKIAEVTEMLGRPFSFEFEVVHGNHLGRTIGIPTINQPFPDGFILPRFGVYASAVHVDGNIYCGVTNIGVKPTVGSERALSETWLPDFSGDLYGKTLRLELLGFIRDERKFPSLEVLRGVIEENAVTAREIYGQYVNESGAY